MTDVLQALYNTMVLLIGLATVFSAGMIMFAFIQYFSNAGRMHSEEKLILKYSVPGLLISSTILCVTLQC